MEGFSIGSALPFLIALTLAVAALVAAQGAVKKHDRDAEAEKGPPLPFEGDAPAQERKGGRTLIEKIFEHSH